DSMRVSMQSSSIQVIVKNTSGNKDSSVMEALRPMAHFNFKQQDGKKFLIQLAPDTISIDTLRTVFTKNLQEAGLPKAFLMRHEFITPERGSGFRTRLDAPVDRAKDEHLHLYRDTMQLESIRLNPVSRYSASLLAFRGYILKSIAPQILFSILLTSITIIAFVVLYKNLLSQQRLMEIKNDFISNVTHELKTPVATVSVALEALKSFHGLDNPERTKEYLEIAQNELSRLTLMTDKILKAGAFENQEVVIEKRPVNLRTITQQVLDSLKLLFDKNKAHVSFETSGNDFETTGEASHLTNVIYNLLDNALKYSPNGPSIKVLLQENETNLTITIEDNGLGIPSEYKAKIFEKFFRVPTGDVHNIKGYGLGLSYVSSVVKAHGGSTEVESEPGKGSTFIITLPKTQT
ncbi:MAG TPA: HAMP domain-containing sensor histidine kinase, partial [Cyclobacteriaceae bacterium]|nr:HAMP domain-containing sensor histidine kinase [Cyclobacteriaceae bacterium]